MGEGQAKVSSTQSYQWAYSLLTCHTNAFTYYYQSYIEEFWYESYLAHSDPVVLALNPFFVLECVFLSLEKSFSPPNSHRYLYVFLHSHSHPHVIHVSLLDIYHGNTKNQIQE